jgi:hypothetical protein
LDPFPTSGKNNDFIDVLLLCGLECDFQAFREIVSALL